MSVQHEIEIFQAGRTVTQVIEKPKQALIHVNIMNANRTKKSTVIFIFSEPSIPLDFTAQCRLSHRKGEK